MFDISHESSNRTVLIKDPQTKTKDHVPVRYSDISFLEAYNSFDFKYDMSMSTFLKYISKIYKKPHRNFLKSIITFFNNITKFL
jgi:hypothetical protein